MKIIISPYSSVLRTGLCNAKNFPWWPEVVARLVHDGHHVTQVGLPGEVLVPLAEFMAPRLGELFTMVTKCDVWASVDNFMPHLCSHTHKRGVVIFSRSDPVIFGYPVNVNLLKSRSFLRPDQFGIWTECAFDPDTFVGVDQVVAAIENCR